MSRRFFPILSLVLVGLTLQFPAFAQRELKDIPVPDPELERQSFTVADGFEVNLYAADPLLAKPIQMNFDAAGRLWIASSEIYPQIPVGAKANDKIIVLEDNDGDGVAETTRIFADGLLIPTGVEPGDGGAYVANSTELIHIADTDGDGKGDRREVILSGFGTEDTHHILHTLRWGPEGLLYFNQSIYIHSHIETPYGVRRLNGGGIWHFRPETRELEVFARGFVNTWGHHFDKWGQSFATDGAFGEGVNYVFPGAAFFTAVGAERILHGLNPGSPKHCGIEVVGGSHLPPDWQGNIITNDFRAHRVCRFVLSENASGYTSREQAEVIKTTHVAFRPIDVKMGPDGAIYIADWYNPIIQHGEVDFRDPRRDHVHGRIWRVTAKGRPLVPRPQIVGKSPAELLELLKSPEAWTRHHARRLLKEQGPDAVLPELNRWVSQLNPQSPETASLSLEALWTYQALDIVNEDLLRFLLNSGDHHLRAAAVRVIYHWHSRLSNSLELVAARADDDHPQVRLEAVRTLSQIKGLPAAVAAVRVLHKPMDENLDYALWLTLRELQSEWIPPFRDQAFDFNGDFTALEFAVRAANSADLAAPLLKLVQQGKIPSDKRIGILNLLTRWGDPAVLEYILTDTVTGKYAPAERGQLIRSLIDAAKNRKTLPAGNLAQVLSLIDQGDAALSADVCRAVGAWNLSEGLPKLISLAVDGKQPESARVAAIEALAPFGDAGLDALRKILADSEIDPVRVRAVESLAGSRLNDAAVEGVRILSEQGGLPYTESIIQTFIKRKEGAAALTKALKEAKLPLDIAKVAVRTAGSAGNADVPLTEALRHAGGMQSGELPPMTPEEMQALVAEIKQSGDPQLGEKIFRRQSNACQKCHSIAGAGGLVGPDLMSIGASAQVDYLVDSLLYPSKAIKENYNTIVLATDDGLVQAGIKVRETEKEVVLRNADDLIISVPVAKIEERADGKSLMPTGLTESLTHEELIHLARFLSELGKVGPYAVGRERLIRRWQSFDPRDPAVHILHRTRLGSVTGDHAEFAWLPIYSQVNGELPLDELPVFRMNPAPARVTVVRFQLEQTQPGPVAVKFNSFDGLTVWRNGEPVAPAETVQWDGTPGIQTFTIAVDLAARATPLRCELIDVPNSAAQIQPAAAK